MDAEHVKKNFHRFCFYDKHYFLDEQKNINPDIYFFANIICNSKNNMVFGKNKYVYENRNSFISHLIIIDEKKELDYVKNNFIKMLSDDIFDFEFSSPEKEDLDLTSVTEKNIFLYKDYVFDKLNINQNEFKSLLDFILLSLKNKKQLFIKLDCDRKNCSYMALLILKFAFKVLPKNIVENATFITYAHTFPLKNFFNIVFVDKEVNFDEINDAYKLDFTNKLKIENYDYFFDFCWYNIFYSNIELIDYTVTKFSSEDFNIWLYTKENRQNFYDSLFGTLITKKQIFLQNQTSYFVLLKLWIEYFSVEIKNSSNKHQNIKLIFLEMRNKYLEKYKYKPSIDNIIYFFLKIETEAFNFSELGFLLFIEEGFLKKIENSFEEIDNYKEFLMMSYFYLKNFYKLNYCNQHQNLLPFLKNIILKKSNIFKNTNITFEQLENLDELIKM